VSRTPFRDAQSLSLVPYVLNVVNESEHPRDEEIAAFLDGGLSASDRATMSRHLAACDDCRALLGVLPERATSHVIARTRGRRSLRVWPALVGIAAAAIVVVNLSSRSRRGGGREADELRGDTAQTVEGSVLSVLAPMDGARVLVDTLVLRWTSAGAGSTYDVSIVDAVGDELWSARVTATELAIPAETRARLQSDATYYWRADAVLPDLRTASTGPQGFVPIRR